MTTDKTIEEVREKIKQFLCDCAMGKYNTENMNLEEQFYFRADKILSLPEIAILHPDQTPPEFLTIGGLSAMELVNETRKSMKGWKRVL